MVTTRILGALVALAALTACSPSTSPSATPSAPTGPPTPTFLCTPDAGGAAAPCTQDEHEQMKARDAEYAEAERLYRATWDLRIAAYRGEPHQDPADLAQGSALESLRDDISAGISIESGEPQVVRFSRLVGLVRDGSTLAAEVCLDRRDFHLVAQGKPIVWPTGFALERVYFLSDDTTAKVVYVEYKGVDQC